MYDLGPAVLHIVEPDGWHEMSETPERLARGDHQSSDAGHESTQLLLQQSVVLLHAQLEACDAPLGLREPRVAHEEGLERSFGRDLEVSGAVDEGYTCRCVRGEDMLRATERALVDGQMPQPPACLSDGDAVLEREVLKD